MPRLMITLEPAERVALQLLSERERRKPRDQAAWLIRRGLERAEILPLGETRIKAKQGKSGQVQIHGR